MIIRYFNVEIHVNEKEIYDIITDDDVISYMKIKKQQEEEHINEV